MADALPRGTSAAVARVLRDAGLTVSQAEAMAALAEIARRSWARDFARHVLALDALDRARQVERTSNKGPFWDMRTSLRRAARGEDLPELPEPKGASEEMSPDA